MPAFGAGVGGCFADECQRKDPLAPLSMILMGGPVDTRFNPTAVNNLAKEKGVGWFRKT